MSTTPDAAGGPRLSVFVLPGPDDGSLARTLDGLRKLEVDHDLLVAATPAAQKLAHLPEGGLAHRDVAWLDSVADGSPGGFDRAAAVRAAIRWASTPHLIIVRPGDVLFPAGVAAAVEALDTHPETVAHIARAIPEPPAATPPAVGLADVTIVDPAWARSLLASPALVEGRPMARSLLSCGLNLIGPSSALTIRTSTLSPDDIDDIDDVDRANDAASDDAWTMRLALRLLLRGLVSYNPNPGLSVPAPSAADILAEHEARPALIELAHRVGHLDREDELADAILAHQDAASAFVRQVVTQGLSAPAERVRGLLVGAAALWERLESARLPVAVRVRPGPGDLGLSLRSARLLTDQVAIADDPAPEPGPIHGRFPVLTVEAGDEIEVVDRADLAARLRSHRIGDDALRSGRGIRLTRQGVAGDWMDRTPMGVEPTSDPVRFAIVAPDYATGSGGIIALHRLCDRLNVLGHDAAIWTMNTGITNPQWSTPVLTSADDLADRVLIYPEIISGNPLGGTRVVRWLLNRPGHFPGCGPLDAAPDDLVVAWNEVIGPDLPVFDVPVVDASIFYPKAEPGSGALLWVGKGSIPADFDRSSATLITRSWPATKVHLGAQLRSTSVLYSADWMSAMVFESLLCGTPVILIGDGGPWERSDVAADLDVRGVGWPGDDIEKLRADAAVRHDGYLRDVARCDSDVSTFVDLVRDHFGGSPRRSVLAGKAILAGKDGRIVIAYGVCIGSDEKYSRVARVGLTRCAASDAPIAESRDNSSIFPAYNEILDFFAADETLEALVLLHEDVELRDDKFETKVRMALCDPSVAVIGAIGARGVRSLAWWDGEGRGRCPETRFVVDYGRGAHDVDAVDGLLLVLSPWAVRNLRFDATMFHGFHAYDVDICFQARAAGKRVRTMDVELFHHTKGGFGDADAYARADRAFQTKWARQLAA